MAVANQRRRIVAVIGNADATPEQIELAGALGRLIVDAGWRLVSGGLGGVMEAASRGARASAAYREGAVLGILPGPDANHANAFVDVAIPTSMGYARNTLVVGCADGVVAVGGGSGTLTEIAMAWQMGKPIVGLLVEGWSGRLAGTAIDQRSRPPIQAAADAPAAIDLLRAAFA